MHINKNITILFELIIITAIGRPLLDIGLLTDLQMSRLEVASIHYEPAGLGNQSIYPFCLNLPRALH